MVWWFDKDLEKEVIFFTQKKINLKKASGMNPVSGIWKLTILCSKDFLLFSSNFDDQLNPKFHRFVILCIYWDTPSENTGLWQSPKVYPAFKNSIHRKPDSYFMGMLHAKSILLHHNWKWSAYLLLHHQNWLRIRNCRKYELSFRQNKSTQLTWINWTASL